MNSADLARKIDGHRFVVGVAALVETGCHVDFEGFVRADAVEIGARAGGERGDEVGAAGVLWVLVGGEVMRGDVAGNVRGCTRQAGMDCASVAGTRKMRACGRRRMRRWKLRRVKSIFDAVDG